MTINKQYYDFMGLSEDATLEEVELKYNSMRTQFLEDRFLVGEEGNLAAKNLQKLETAYNAIINERNEQSEVGNNDSALGEVDALIRNGDIEGAQRKLDTFDERGGEWHYLQSVIYYKKNWRTESKTQLEIAMQIEPNNEKYKKTYEKLNNQIDFDAQAEKSQNNQYNYVNNGQQQMGGSFCDSCIACLCLNCLCQGCCGN